ncbi:hypothetical protein LOY54_25485 [Pseudomonas sp. B21-032]|uniref:hypothetical protein n=1 Tax=Pseudomonas sp. B21-032 TaxID=2895483 RepID=UPI00215F1982|nr:hypothetical protein [Pseudomonas sp. B21-032]UVL61314.1 hypothetical protein LOY54_25485 [Pseudomonas sp. B21-032]
MPIAFESYNNAAQIACLSTHLPVSTKEDILRSSLLAQMSADKQPYHSIQEWHSHYSKALGKLGWVFTTEQLTEYTSSLGSTITLMELLQQVANPYAIPAQVWTALNEPGQPDPKKTVLRQSAFKPLPGQDRLLITIEVLIARSSTAIKKISLALETKPFNVTNDWLKHSFACQDILRPIQIRHSDASLKASYSNLRSTVTTKLGSHIQQLTFELPHP